MKKLLIFTISAYACMAAENKLYAASALLCTFCESFVNCIDDGLIAGETDMLFHANQCRDELCLNTPQLTPIAQGLIDNNLDYIVLQLEDNARPIDICNDLKLCGGTCPPCTDCTSDETCTIVRPGYEGRIERYCNCGTCESDSVMRCAAGYYGNITNGTTGCTQCPTFAESYGTSVAGSTEITACYLSTDTNFSDAVGTFSFTSDCYYEN